MRKLILIWMFLAGAGNAIAQLNNSWIDYSKTYYKFRLAKDTLCRIYQPALVAAGLGNVNAEEFQLWKNGEQIRLFTSVVTGPLASSDYLEFWGEMNDGRPDNGLYRDPDYQLNSRYSLETDTAVYFLTVNPAGGNLRYATGINTPPGTASPDPYFIRNIDVYFKKQINRGFANVVGEYLYSSSYDMGEGFTTGEVFACCELPQPFNSLNVYSAGPDAVSVRVNATGNAANNRLLRVRLGNNLIYSSPMNGFSYQRVNVTNLPLSYLSNLSSVSVYVKDSSSITTDRLVVASMGISYPARFNFNNLKIFDFELAAAPSGNYLVIDNFSYGALAPILYDLTQGVRYTGDIVSTPGKVKFVLPPSGLSNRKFRLMNQEAGSINVVSQLSTKAFLDIRQTANQGDYIIISNPLLFNDGNGNNYVEEYRQYRSSPAGGGFSGKVYDINELTDQFAFGIKRHPAAIRDFIRYAYGTFVPRPKYVFLIGRSVNYRDSRTFESNPLNDKLNLVPTFGWPPSDILLASDPGTLVPKVPIGRLGAITPNEVNAYLQKVIQYEDKQRFSSPLVDDRAWMKNIIHVVGGKDSLESETFRQYMLGYERIARDTLFGGHVETFTKTGTATIQQANSRRIEDLLNDGVGFIGYFGHSSANTFEFNLSDPSVYNNTGKYPFFNVSGCSAGNYYVFDSLRFSGNLTISEKYVLAAQKGSIGFLADTHFGIPPFLNYYNTALYTAISKTMYGNTIGNQIKKVTEDIGGNPTTLDYYSRIHLEEIALHGDPAIKINNFSKPDYAVEDQFVKVSPNIITIADTAFSLKVNIHNLGKAKTDSLLVTITRKLPNDSVQVLYNDFISNILNEDSVSLLVPINPITDKGLNRISVTLDGDNRIDELYETNNAVSKDVYIFEDELRPIYPYNYSIVNRQNIIFYASTANPLSGMRQYVMEIDTTENFNSSFRRIYNHIGPGGVVDFQPAGLSFSDSTVYYWRVAMVPSGNSNYIWNGSSFIYLAGSGQGFNQSHYFQHQKSSFENIALGADRNFHFEVLPRSLTIRTGIYPYFNYDRINVNLDFNQLEYYGCGYSALQFYVFDTTTLIPWRNRNVSATNALYGSRRLCPANPTDRDTSRAFFEYNYSDSLARKNAMDFIDSIPDGMFVAITNLARTNNITFINNWMDDTLNLGSGRSLYHKFKEIGFTEIDSFTRNLPFLYFFRKGRAAFAPTQIVGQKDSSYIDQTFYLNSVSTSGSITSPFFGPAKKWKYVHWRGNSADPVAPVGDKVKVQVWGLSTAGSKDLLATLNPAIDSNIDFIDAHVYPFLSLRMLNEDGLYVTPNQLRYFRLDADFIPEGAVAPATLLSLKDTLEQGEPLNFMLAFRNISETVFDTTMKFRLSVTDKNNVTRFYPIPRGKVLIPNDTLTVKTVIDTRDLTGVNSLSVEVNPDYDQREMYRFNNILFKEFYVRPDKFNPLLDVTFDGVHILNRDIVASRPNILIKLNDESRYLALSDTSLMNVQVKFPNESSPREYRFDGDTMRFIPADLSTGHNAASIEFNPYFANDGEYELVVSGKDVAENPAGNLNYRVTFNVINKPMISNLFNYPNPFTTSTAFVFTLTGSEVPQNLRIQILTITGKIVREITKEELGSVHIGNNITDFKWDGTDMYGQKLANGVYLYRVLTNLNGRSLDKYGGFNSNSELITDGLAPTDKYFIRGYGKMYLMR